MRLSEFKKRNIPFYPILFLEKILPHRLRHKILFLGENLFYVFIILLLISKIYNHEIPLLINLLGLTLSFLSVAVVILLLEAFFRSYYFGVNSSLLLAGRMVYQAKNGDMVSSLFMVPTGKKLAFRSGFSSDALNKFLESRAGKIFDYELPDFGLGHFFAAKDLILCLFKQDESFRRYLLDHGFGEKDLAAVIDWVLMEEDSSVVAERWWSRERLSSRRAIGKDWAFGRTFYLDKFSVNLSSDPELFSSRKERSYRDDLVNLIEISFSKSKSANVIIVGDVGVGVFGVILDFVRKIVSGRVHSNVAYSRVLVLDWNLLVSEMKNKTSFEEGFMRCLKEALAAGNIVLVIEDLPSFIVSAGAMGSDIMSLLAPYLDKEIQIVATADPVKFHQLIEPNSLLTQYFEKIIVTEPDEIKSFETVENFLMSLESDKKIKFTYPAVAEIIKAANYYFSSGVMPAKAINLVSEISASVSFTGDKIITKKEVLDFIRIKTKIPVGEIYGQEKEVLLNLEDSLHKRVIGQNEAIDSISSVLRRARAGVRDPKKPAGSFLFLGPTGVGKTETAKALAQIFYGDEKYMLRLDMSEFQSDDSLNRLIGSFGENKPGILSKMIRDNPYGVLLLDEFEKADRDVLNLFLQILDEGFFGDMTGKRVSAQNLILIATSNAASDIIFDLTERGENISSLKSEIIGKIVSRGIYRPELINRFDDVVLFHPLNKDELEKIAVLMLKKLARRLQEKGIELVINSLVVQKMVDAGYNRTFGARPMNRAIQERVEEPIARKIISGELAPGSKMEFSETDFT